MSGAGGNLSLVRIPILTARSALEARRFVVVCGQCESHLQLADTNWAWVPGALNFEQIRETKLNAIIEPRHRTVASTWTVVLAALLAVGLLAPMAHAHSAIAGSGLKNSGEWVHYQTDRWTEADRQGIRVDTMPGRPMNMYLRNPANGNQLGTERRWTEAGQWRWFTDSWDLSLGTAFRISAKKDKDSWWGKTNWDGIIHW